jgi:AraC-like DNA-binding protein
MQPYRKSFDSPNFFPYFMDYKNTKSPQNELPNHLHDWVEIVYVYQGKGTFFVDNAFHDMRQGDVFMIPSNTIHQAFPDKEQPVTSTAIFFSPVLIQATILGEPFSYLQLFEMCKKRRYYKFSLSADQQQTLESEIASLYSEQLEQQVGFRHAIVSGLQQALLFLIRNCPNGRHDAITKRDSGSKWIRHAFQYIENNLTNGIRLTDLARNASVAPAHFSRVFKKLTGINLTAFITQKKIIKAKELLHGTDEKIIYIAEQCGFESMPHFHRTFKRYVGMTPAEFRGK